MLGYHAAYYQGEKGWIVGHVLDFPAAASQGRTLRSARKMLRDALREMAETLLENGQPLPAPNPKAQGKKAIFQENLFLRVRVPGGEIEKAKTTSVSAKKRLHRL